MEPSLFSSFPADADVGWWNVDQQGRPLRGPYRLWEQAEEPVDVPESDWGWDLVYGRRSEQNVIDVMVAPEERDYAEHVADQLRHVEVFDTGGTVLPPEGPGGARTSPVDRTTDLGRLAIAVGAALVDMGFRLQSVNLHEQDEVGGVVVWPERDRGVTVTWTLHHFLAIRWPRGDVNQLAVLQVMTSAVAAALRTVGFTVTHVDGHQRVTAAPDAYLDEHVFDGKPYLSNG